MTYESTREVQEAGHGEGSTALEQTRPGPVYTPGVDIFEDGDAITLLADMPGVPADGLRIDLHEGVLTMTGNVAAGESDSETVVYREYSPGLFYRQFTLSDRIDQDRIEAQLKDGVLRLVLPKAEASKPRQIPVKSS